MNTINFQYYKSTISNEQVKCNYNTIYHILKQPVDKNNIINNNIYRDLEIFSGYNDNINHNLIDILDFTYTYSGKIKLHNMISQPSDDIIFLYKRQLLLQIYEPKLNLLDSILEKIKIYEDDIIELWNTDKMDYLQNQLKLVYFQNQYLKFINNNRFLLGLYNIYRIVLSPIFTIISPLVFFVLPFVMVKLVYKFPISFVDYYRLLKLSWSNYSNFLPNSNSSHLFRYIGISFWLFGYLQGMYNSYEISSNTLDICNKVYHKLHTIKELVNYAEKLQEICKLNNNTYSLSVCKNIIQDFSFSNSTIHYGKMLHIFHHVLINKNAFINCLHIIGNVDCYISIIKLKNKYNYSYCQYIKNNTPIISAKHIYHPSFEENDTIIKNNIKIGNKKRTQNIIITGANAGGKSTFIKSVAISILLSQTFTITPCSQFKITPFSIINTYLNIPDDKCRNSLFQAELNRTIEHIQKVKSLKPSLHSLIIMDEIFSSTNPDDAVTGAYTLMNVLSQFNNNITIFTTHFKKLTQLSETKPFINYYFPIKKVKDKIVFLYKLKKGISTDSIANELIDSILKKISINPVYIE